MKKTAIKQELTGVFASAQRLGIEMDEEKAIQWVKSISEMKASQEISVDPRTGIFGQKVTMLDFDPADLEHFRRIGRVVEFADEPGRVETALALSGSAAQSKVQKYPGDADYFERVNIITSTRDEACLVLAEIMRNKVLSSARGPFYEMIEVKFGSFSQDVRRNGKVVKSGSPISWKPEDVQAGRIEIETLEGQPSLITWEEASHDPGWCKLDWVVVDSVREVLVNASNMLDVTWQAPDGSITALDGFLDPYYQEVYLESESLTLFKKLAQHVSGDALDEYVDALEKEIHKYLTKDLNYGKVARRLYNIFRLTGRYEAAAYVRELFDEPASMLYQVWSLIRTIDDTFTEHPRFTLDHLLAHTDRLILDVVDTLEGAEETEVVRLLLRLRDTLSHHQAGQPVTPEIEADRAELIRMVNNFFYDKLVAVPAIKQYLDEVNRPKPLT
jgi:hypothetical protein